ncbi:hypothetical protein P7K49_014969 [Saguinus oedipus]|uniref:Uncharacterized protein n=1 Tax=Saguinus oedipus TaxID=9490 RepID=A0ABQ9V7Y3_SAGOE|nr:hypothetical protein P7K49_014969 [Saguinus oedipus]
MIDNADMSGETLGLTPQDLEKRNLEKDTVVHAEKEPSKVLDPPGILSEITCRTPSNSPKKHKHCTLNSNARPQSLRPCWRNASTLNLYCVLVNEHSQSQLVGVIKQLRKQLGKEAQAEACLMSQFFQSLPPQCEAWISRRVELRPPTLLPETCRCVSIPDPPA